MVTESTTRILLVRAAGKCALCYTDLLKSSFTHKNLFRGERAHIVGKTSDERSPRGEHKLPQQQRDDVDNLMLLCRSCHGEVDANPNLPEFTVERLREIKHRHESRIEQILRVPPDRETAILRLHGTIGGSHVHINRPVAAATVLGEGRVARFPLNHDLAGVEIDLRQIPSPRLGDQEYYRISKERIDALFSQQVTPAVEAGNLRHVSVFALARWPLLAYLGAKLGDKLDAHIYQRHRSTESWAWPATANHSEFCWRLAAGGQSTSDAVLVLSLSAAVHSTEVPSHLDGAPIYRIAPARNVTPHYDIIDSTASLKSAEKAIRDVLADIEQNRKNTDRLHVIGAAPLSVCVTLGRTITSGIHPHLVLYDRVNGQYQPAMEIN